METISEIRERSRKSLHEFMGRPVHYYADPDAPSPTYEAVKAREHSKIERAGDLAGTNLSYAEVHDRREAVRFWMEEMPNPVRNALVIFSPTVGYFINNVLPDDGLTVDCEVTRAEQSDLVGFTAPDGTVIGA